MLCGVLACIGILLTSGTYWNILEHIGTYWNILEHIRTYWNVLEHIGTTWNLYDPIRSVLDYLGCALPPVPENA